jgi:uncharacterized membrane protein YhaH (DUF805 family)
MSRYVTILRNLVTFDGRARRTEFWTFALISAVVGTAIDLTGRHFGTDVPTFLYGLIVIVPAVAVCVRRLHDSGNPGAWLLVVIFPVVGALVLLVFAAWPGTAGANEFGPDPRTASPSLA